MENKVLKILLVEDNLADANLVVDILDKYSWQKSNLKHVKKVTEAIDLLDRDNFDAILLDLFLPDSQGIASLDIVKQKAPQLPILILTATDDLNMAVRSLRQGAQDYLIKGEFEGKRLTRSIQYAIERQRSEFTFRQQALMKEMLDKIRNSIDLEAILKTTATQIQQFLQSDRVLIHCDESHTSATTVVSPSADALADCGVDRFVEAVNLLRRSIFTESDTVSAVEDTTIASGIQADIRGLVRSYLILPIWVGKSVECTYEMLSTTSYDSDLQTPRGILIAYNVNRTRKWPDWEINFLQRLTTQVTIAIAQSQLCCQLQTANQKLQQLAILDGLTGIANRRYFDLVLNKEWQRLAREQQPLSLILCDIDYFKAYNDAYGHQQGDRCLRKIARILRQAARRPADLAARYGGEEFAIILPNTDSQGALFIAQKIMNRLAKAQIPHKKSEVSNFVTLSIGITTKIPRPKQSVRTIINVADRLLYKAKTAGRDRLASDSQSRFE